MLKSNKQGVLFKVLSFVFCGIVLLSFSYKNVLDLFYVGLVFILLIKCFIEVKVK